MKFRGYTLPPDAVVSAGLAHMATHMIFRSQTDNIPVEAITRKTDAIQALFLNADEDALEEMFGELPKDVRERVEQEMGLNLTVLLQDFIVLPEEIDEGHPIIMKMAKAIRDTQGSPVKVAMAVYEALK